MISPQSLANLTIGDSNPLSDSDRSALVRMAGDGLRYREMSEATGRPIGTIKTALFRLRRDGLVDRRYAEWDRADA